MCKEHERLIQEHDAAKQAWLHCILPDFCAEKKALWQEVKTTEKALDKYEGRSYK
jgi:hypothetical protein